MIALEQDLLVRSPPVRLEAFPLLSGSAHFRRAGQAALLAVGKVVRREAVLLSVQPGDEPLERALAVRPKGGELHLHHEGIASHCDSLLGAGVG